jgi:hypothetical protein
MLRAADDGAEGEPIKVEFVLDGPGVCPSPMGSLQKWAERMRPVVRRELVTNLLVGVHPLMAFLPTDQMVDMPCDHPLATGEHYQLIPLLVRVVGADGRDEIHFNEKIAPPRFGVFDVEGSVTGSVELAVDEFGVTCPHLIARRVTFTAPPLDPPDVLENLDRLARADLLLKRGAELVQTGQFFDAVNCFEEVHRLVPGTNLEARAGEAAQNLLVRALAAFDDKEASEEQSEPEKSADPATPSCSDEQKKCDGKACSEFATAHREKVCKVIPAQSTALKPRTIVYPVADLLGRGRDTRHDDIDELAGVIANTIEPQSWVENGGQGSIDFFYRSRAIVIRQTPDVHEQVVDLLAALRRAKAESSGPVEKLHRPTPLTGHTVKTAPQDDCCEECCPGDCCQKPAPCIACPCDQIPVLVLPRQHCTDAFDCPEMQLFVEGCTCEDGAQKPAQQVCCSVGSACLEAGKDNNEIRTRLSFGIGPLVLTLKYQHHDMRIEIGLVTASEETASEECEKCHP